MGFVMTRRSRFNGFSRLVLLTSRVRSPLSTRAAVADGSRSRHLTGVLCVALLLPYPAQAVESKDSNYFKLYAHSLIIDSKEYRCLDLLWTRESNWNPLSHNKSGGAYGIPQLKNARIQHLDGFSQIRFGLKYIKHRHSTPCKAWTYWQTHRNY
jgi:hypothetical protein